MDLKMGKMFILKKYSIAYKIQMKTKNRSSIKQFFKLSLQNQIEKYKEYCFLKMLNFSIKMRSII